MRSGTLDFAGLEGSFHGGRARWQRKAALVVREPPMIERKAAMVNGPSVARSILALTGNTQQTATLAASCQLAPSALAQFTKPTAHHDLGLCLQPASAELICDQTTPVCRHLNQARRARHDECKSLLLPIDLFWSSHPGQILYNQDGVHT